MREGALAPGGTPIVQVNGPGAIAGGNPPCYPKVGGFTNAAFRLHYVWKRPRPRIEAQNARTRAQESEIRYVSPSSGFSHALLSVSYWRISPELLPSSKAKSILKSWCDIDIRDH